MRKKRRQNSCVVGNRKREYISWNHMIQESHRKSTPVEAFLENFDNFCEVMGPRPEGMTLRRIDSARGYERGNLEWHPARKTKPPRFRIRGRVREYNSWKNMMIRCYYPSHEAFKFYGKQGVYVEPFLQDFENFFSYMGVRPEGTSLDRIDCNRSYERGNLRWSTLTEQNNNQRRSRKFTMNGRSLTIGQWARETGIPYGVLYRRIKEQQWPVEKALTEPIESPGRETAA